MNIRNSKYKKNPSSFQLDLQNPLIWKENTNKMYCIRRLKCPIFEYLLDIRGEKNFNNLFSNSF